MFENIQDIRVFTVIFQENSLSQAARILQMTPGMVSRQLSKLEEDLGLRLFHRTTRSVQPTEEGKRLYAQAMNLFEMIESYENEWGGLTEAKGILKVSASASFGRLHLMPVITKFLKEYPKIQIQLDLSDRVVNIIEEGVDVAIRIGARTDSTLVAKRLGSGTRLLCASPSYLRGKDPIRTPVDLDQHNCVVLNQNYVWDFEGPGGELYSQKVRGNFQCNFGEAMSQCVKAGLGIGIISYWHAKGDLNSGELQVVLPDFRLNNNPSIYAVYPSRKYVPLRTKVFVSYLEEHLQIPELDEGTDERKPDAS